MLVLLHPCCQATSLGARGVLASNFPSAMTAPTVTGTRELYHDVHIGTQQQHHLKNHNCKQHGCREQERIRALIQINSNSDTSTPIDKSYDYKLVIATTVNHRRSGITRSTTDRSSIAESTATSPPMGRTFLVQRPMPWLRVWIVLLLVVVKLLLQLIVVLSWRMPQHYRLHNLIATILAKNTSRNHPIWI